LVTFHFFLISTGQKTYEFYGKKTIGYLQKFKEFKTEAFARSGKQWRHNYPLSPFNLGCCRNIKAALMRQNM